MKTIQILAMADGFFLASALVFAFLVNRQYKAAQSIKLHKLSGVLAVAATLAILVLSFLVP
jgi:hypothetical protein